MFLVLAIATLAVLAFVWWWMLPFMPTPRPPRDPVALALPHDAGEEAPQASADAPRRAADVAAPVGDEGGRTAIATPGLPIRVVDVHGRLPVHGAVVRHGTIRFEDSTTEEAEELVAQSHRDIEVFLERTGGETTTDAEGRCRVPLPGPTGLWITARADSSFGSLFLPPTRDPSRERILEVGPDHTLRVLAVDVDGRPAAGIRIGSKPRNAAGAEFWQIGVTGPEGRLEIAHAQTRMPNGQAPGVLDLFALVPGRRGAAVAVDWAAPPPEVVLHLPATGSVTVRVLEADGTPIDIRYSDRRRVRLAAFAAPVNDANEPSSPSIDLPGEAEIGPGGVASFAHVGLDRYLIAGFDTMASQPSFAGPTAGRMHVEVALRRDPGHVVVTGRLLDVDGEPLAHRRIEMCCAPEVRGTFRTRTAEDARFRLDLGAGAVGAGRILRIDLLPASRPGKGVELPACTLRAGDNDLGDIAVAAPRLVVAGRVVREAGVHPTERPPLHVERRIGDRWFELPGSGAFAWPEVDRFELRQVVPEGAVLRLAVANGSWQPVAPIEFTAGATDLAVTLVASASVSATFLIDEATPHLLQFALTRSAPHDASGPPPVWGRGWPMSSAFGREPAGTVCQVWSGLPAGTYRLTVRCRGEDRDLVAIDSIALRSGPCADPRLQSIDLRGRARSLHVRVRDEDGRVPSDAIVVPVHDGNRLEAFEVRDGSVQLPVSGPTDLLVIAPGRRVQRLPRLSMDADVTLSPAGEVRIRVLGVEGVPPGMALRLCVEAPSPLAEGVVLQRAAGRSHLLADLFVEQVQVGDDGTATAHVRVPGLHRVRLELDGLAVATAERELDLQDGGTATLHVDAAALRTVLERRR